MLHPLDPSNDIEESGVMAGLDLAEIQSLMDQQFRTVLMDMSGTEFYDKVHKLWWLTGHALEYAQSAGIAFVHLNRGQA